MYGSHLQAETGLLGALVGFASRVPRVNHAGPSGNEMKANMCGSYGYEIQRELQLSAVNRPMAEEGLRC